MKPPAEEAPDISYQGLNSTTSVHGQLLGVEKFGLPIKLLTALNADDSAFQIRRHPQTYLTEKKVN